MKNTKKSQNKSQTKSKLTAVTGILAVIAALVSLLTGELFINRFPGGSFFAVVTRLISMALVIYALICLLRVWYPRLSNVLLTIWFTCAAIMVILFIVVEILIASGDSSDYEDMQNPPSRYMIVLGAGLRGYTPSISLTSRLDRAAEQLIACPDMLVVVSGGQGEGEFITEAQAMFEYLVLKGIPPENILKEEASVNTMENISFSMDILRGRDAFNPDEGVIVCSSGYHLFRARILLGRHGVEPYALDAKVPRLHLLLTGYLREFFSVILMWRNL